eukprot:jgi/Picre1/29822/NNA_005204.t1
MAGQSQQIGRPRGSSALTTTKANTMVAVPSLFRGCLDRNASSSSMTQRWHGPIKTALNDEAILSKTVDEIMTTGRIVTCSPDTSLDDALELIVEHHVTGLPVVDEENRVVGIISDFDLLALEGVQKLVEKNAGTTVSDVMTTDPVCVRALTSIPSAAHLLLHKRIRRLPVTDDEGRLIGIITRSNIIKAAWESRKTKQV